MSRRRRQPIPLKIRNIHLKNIGVFEDEKIEFQSTEADNKAEIHIFTGTNGSGKTTILHSLAGILGFRTTEESTQYPPKYYVSDTNNILKRFKYNTPESFVAVTLRHSRIQVHKDEKNVNKLLTAHSSLENHVRNFCQALTNENSAYLDTPFSFAAFGYSSYRNVTFQPIHAIKEVTSNPFYEALTFNKSISETLSQWIANTIAKKALALASKQIQDAENYQNSITRIQEAIGKIIDAKVNFILKYNPFKVLIEIHGQALDFDMLPDGIKSLISWIADLLMRMDRIKWENDIPVFDRKFILFLDEIEVHLHPAWQRKVLPVVQKLFKNAQIFVSTHSPFVVNSISDAWVYKLEVENGNAKVAEILPAQSGQDYDTVLEEVFGIEEDFDIETEKLFDEFYEFRNQILAKKEVNETNFLQLAKELAIKSLTVKNIVISELLQVNRKTGKNYQL